MNYPVWEIYFSGGNSVQVHSFESGGHFYYYKQPEEGYRGLEDFKKEFPEFSGIDWTENYPYKAQLSLATNKLERIFIIRFGSYPANLFLNGQKIELGGSEFPLLDKVKFLEGNIGFLHLYDRVVLFPAEVFGKVYTLTTKVLEDSLKTVLDEKNTDLVLVKRDCPYIPLRSLNGTGGAIYRDGEYLTLNKLGKTFKVFGSFHFVKDTDLNLAIAYVLGDDKPSLVVPQLILETLKGV